MFINYAHRGASEYLPENTFLAFYNGIYMGANGIETDVQKTKDGVLVLFHDDTITRVTGKEGAIKDYSFNELQEFDVMKNGFRDKIVAFEDFLKHFKNFPLTFAIELKSEVAIETAEMLRKYNMQEKTVVTSFNFEYIKKFKEFAPEFRIGWLVRDIGEDVISQLRAIGGEEICPKAEQLTKENVAALHSKGFTVRAWGVFNEEIMKNAVESGADGMTINFPDKLTAYMANKYKD